MGNTVKRTSEAFQPTAVDPKQHLWHIMPTWKLNTFLYGGLWLARMDEFGDSCEGTLPRRNQGLLYKLLTKQVVPAVLREYEFGVKRAYVSCWHICKGDPTDHVWQTFGLVGLRTTPDLMKEALQYVSGPDGPVHFGKIRYIDHLQDTIPDANTIEAGFVVQNNYKLECEARVLIHTHGTAASDFLYGKKGVYGNLVRAEEPSASFSGRHEFVGGHNKGKAIVLKIDPKRFITELVIHSSTPNDKKQQIIAQLEKVKLKDKLRL